MLNNDKPKIEIKDDILEFDKLYESIATYLSKYKDADTLTISIEGEWGSGKTTLSNFIIEKIKEKCDISVIKFSPWMITDLNKLVEYFFLELMKTVLHLSKGAKKDELIRDFKKFVSFIAPDKLTFGVAEYSTDKFFNNQESIFEIKENIATYLSDLKSKILIVVDDIDRLTDSETEVFFRLIKGIADFDNLIYLLLLDKVIVSDSLKKFKNEDGEKYLDKIIQYSIPIPKISYDILKKELISEISEIYEPELNNIKFFKFFKIFNKYIKNLRDVKRLSNSLKIEYPLVKDNVDFIDFMIITLIKNNNNKLFNFIKNNKYLFLINHSIEDTEMYKQKVIKIFEYEHFNTYLDLIEIIFPILNNINVSYDTKNNYIASLKSFNYYFSFSCNNETYENEIVNAIDNIITSKGNLISSLQFLISKEKGIEFIDQFSLFLSNNEYYVNVSKYVDIITKLLYAYSWIQINDNIDNIVLKEKIMIIIKFLIKKLDSNKLISLFNTNNLNPKNSILIYPVLLENNFENISINEISTITPHIKTQINNSIKKEILCAEKDGIIVFKGTNNYDIISNAIKYNFDTQNFDVNLKNFSKFSKESFFNILKEFKTYVVKNFKYIPIIDKKLLFNFVNKEVMNNYSNLINFDNLTAEERLLLTLYKG